MLRSASICEKARRCAEYVEYNRKRLRPLTLMKLQRCIQCGWKRVVTRMEWDGFSNYEPWLPPDHESGVARLCLTMTVLNGH